jgi:hypothetical protein
MPSYASEDAEHVAHGVRLGGRGDLLDAVSDGQPLTIEALERLTRPDLYEPDEDGETRPTGETGMLRLYTHADGNHTIACDWYGWLPGHYTTRQAAHVAYGYVLGGENAGPLDKLAQPRLDGYTLAEIEAFAAQ